LNLAAKHIRLHADMENSMPSTKKFQQFGYVSFQLNELLTIINDRANCSLTATLAKCAAQTAGVLDSFLFPNLQDPDRVQVENRLQAELKMLLDEANLNWGSGDEAVTMVQRILASTFRAMKRFVDAEDYDRMDPCTCLSTLAVLAGDIFSQKNRSRYPEVLTLYRQALELGYSELQGTDEPSKVQAEITGVYICLAKVLIAAGAVEEAEEQIDKLISLNSTATAKTNAPPLALIDAYKLLMQMSTTECAAGKNASSARLLSTAIAVASSILAQDCGDLKTRLYLIELLSGTPK